MLLLLYMVRVIKYEISIIDISSFTAHPMLQPVDLAFYVIAGDPFTLNCTATNDVQSPNNLTFKWLQQSIEISNDSSRWSINELSRNTLTVTSQVIITNLTVNHHNGTYVCTVHNFEQRTAVNQTTNVIVESQ